MSTSVVLLAKHSLGFHARAERLGEGFAVPVNRGNDQRILASLKLFNHIGDQRWSESVRVLLSRISPRPSIFWSAAS